MATFGRRRIAPRNVRLPIQAARAKRWIAHLPKRTRRALGRHGAAVARRRRTGATKRKTRRELYEIARRGNLPGRSKLGRAQLARALGRREPGTVSPAGAAG